MRSIRQRPYIWLQLVASVLLIPGTSVALAVGGAPVPAAVFALLAVVVALKVLVCDLGE